MSEINWAVELVALVALQQEKERVTKGRFPASTFSVGAKDVEIEAAERSLGARFAPDHRAFLEHSNGWKGFASSADLFSTNDFLGSPNFLTAQERIRVADSGALGKYASRRKKLVPVSFNEGASDLLLMVRDGAELRPGVVWVSNEIVEEFDSFAQMFVSFKEYCAASIQMWAERLKKQS